MSPDEDLLKRAEGRLGTVLKGKYRLDSVLGFGGMAVVYRATHRNRAQLAVKMLHSELSLNADVRSRFLREGYAANSVNHPGAVLVVDDDVAEDGAAFLVMELLVGVSAEALLDRNRRRLPVPAAATVVHQLLDVLASAHTAGIVHRDIKPANLLVTRDGTVKVLDFGIARVLETALGGGHATGGGLPLGTPAFMAPEQAVARSADIDAQTDVWAAGATFFTLVSGELVHDGPTPAQILVYSATRPARSLAEVVPDVPAQIVAVVDRALAFEKKDRWPSAAAMRDALAEACRSAFGAPPSKESLVPLVLGMMSFAPPSLGDDMASAPTMSAASLPESGKSTSSPVSSARLPSSPAPKPTKRSWPRVAAGLLAILVVFGVVRFARHAPASQVHSDVGEHAVPIQGGRVLVAFLDLEYPPSDPTLENTVEWLLENMTSRSDKVAGLSGTKLRSEALALDRQAGKVTESIGPRLVARWGWRTVVVRGVVKNKGSAYAIDLTATDSLSGTRVATLSETAESSKLIFAAVGRLAVALRTALGDAPADPVEAVKLGFTGSIEAIHEYLLAGAELQDGKYEEAIGHARLALKNDPSFAEAHAMVGVLFLNLERRADGQRKLKDAMQHLDGLSDLRRLRLSSTYHLAVEEFDKAAPELDELSARFPFETGSLHNLGDVYMMMGDIDRALTTMRRAAELTGRVLSHNDLAQIEVLAGMFDEAAREVHRVVAEFPSHPTELTGWLAAAEALQGHRDPALVAYDELAQAEPQNGVLAKADFAMFEGRFDDAAALVRALLEKEPKAHGEATAKAWAMLAEDLELSGDTAGAKQAAAQVAASSDASTLFRAGRVLVRSGAPKLAAPVTESLVASPGMRARVYSTLLSAEALRASGQAQQAQKVIEDARLPADYWLTHATLGKIALDAGSFDVALRELELCASKKGAGALAFVDSTLTLRYLPDVRYALARAREGLGRTDAAEAYAEFLAMEPAAQHDPRVLYAKKRAEAH